MAVEHGIGGDGRDHQPDQRIDGETDIDMDDVDKLHIGHEDAEEIDLHHGPGAQTLDEGEDGAQMMRRAGKPQADQDVGGANELHKRRRDGREEHDDGELPDALLIESFGSRK